MTNKSHNYVSFLESFLTGGSEGQTQVWFILISGPSPSVTSEEMLKHFRCQRVLLSLLKLHTWTTGQSLTQAGPHFAHLPPGGFSVDTTQWKPTGSSCVCNPNVRKR